MDARPWEALPAEAAAAFRPELPALADEIIAAISRGVPDYARPLEGPFGAALRGGVEEALRQFVAMVEDPAAGRGPGRDVYVALGRGEWIAGRRLDALLAAYRLGARVAWRRLAAVGERAGLEPRVLYLLAESIFAYIDELSGESIEGWTREQAAAAGEHQRRRQRLAALLVQDPAADRPAVEDAAAAAAWPLPRRRAALAIEGDDGDRVARRLDTDVLVATVPGAVCALVPDPAGPGRLERIESALEGQRAAIGPAVRWPQAPVSFGRALATLRLAAEGALAGPRTRAGASRAATDDAAPEASGLLRADDHALELLLGHDRRLARDIRKSALAPLDGETPASRERLTETLRAWLRHRGRTEEVARALHVHPQTVRYRLARLRDLFGDDLDDPDARFELELALRAPEGG